MLNLLEELRRRRGLAFVMVSHDLAVVTHLRERLMVMQRGRTVEMLSAADLAAHRVTHECTRNLMIASSGFRRAAPAVTWKRRRVKAVQSQPVALTWVRPPGDLMQLAPLIFVAASLVVGTTDAQDAQDLLRKHDCNLCHADRETRTRPAFAEIAATYRNNPHAAATLVAVVRKGAHGSGPWPMPPPPQVPSADAAKTVAYILALKE